MLFPEDMTVLVIPKTKFKRKKNNPKEQITLRYQYIICSAMQKKEKTAQKNLD